MQECAVVVGAGSRQGIGGAVAAQLAAQGLHVFIAGRTAAKLDALVAEIQAHGGQATAVVTDSTNATAVTALFDQVHASGAALRVVVYNTGRNLPAPFLDANLRLITGHWRRCVLGGLLVGQAAAKHMLAQTGVHKGTIIYTGASASLRGKPQFAAFASAKAGLRALTQSMAKELGPQGIHVGHIVIDGLVGGDVVKRFGKGLGKLLLKQKGQDGALVPDEVAKSFWMLHQQDVTAWTYELDLRPFKEAF